MIDAVSSYAEVVCADVIPIIAFLIRLAAGIDAGTASFHTGVDGAVVVVIAVLVRFTASGRPGRCIDTNPLFARIICADVVTVITFKWDTPACSEFAEIIFGTRVSVRAEVIIEFLDAPKHRVTDVRSARIAVLTLRGGETTPWSKFCGALAFVATIDSAEIEVVAVFIYDTTTEDFLVFAEGALSILDAGV